MIKINGGIPLKGTINVQGAKNSLQFAIAVALFSDAPIIINNVPLIEDLYTFQNIFHHLGCEFEVYEQIHRIKICCKNIASNTIPYKSGSKLRSTLLLIPGLLYRFKKVILPLPGGDPIGTRPLNTHLYVLEKLGWKVKTTQTDLHITAHSPSSAVLSLPFPSFTGTGLAIMLASFLEGTTIIHNAAQEPELTDLIFFLESIGGKISHLDSNVISIEGCSCFKSAILSLQPDRIEVGSYIIAALITNGYITFSNNDLKGLDSLINLLRQMGCKIVVNNNQTTFYGQPKYIPVSLQTGIYPLFPTDLQPQIMALMLFTTGVSSITENMHDNHFLHVPELIKMGATVDINGNIAYIHGNSHLHPASVKAFDIRGGFSLILAALSTNGKTEIHNTYHIRRGYSEIISKLTTLGATIKCTEENAS